MVIARPIFALSAGRSYAVMISMAVLNIVMLASAHLLSAPPLHAQTPEFRPLNAQNPVTPALPTQALKGQPQIEDTSPGSHDHNRGRPAALMADNIPALPQNIIANSANYLHFRSARFVDWDASDKSMIISTRFGETDQLHKVRAPLAQRQQISFGEEPVRSARVSPSGAHILFQRDRGGDEVNQIFALQEGKAQLLTDGKSRNRISAWANNSDFFAFGSNKRTGVYDDIYLMSLRAPGLAQPLLNSPKGGWTAIDFTPDDKKLLVFNYISGSDNQLYLLNLENGTIDRLTQNDTPVTYLGLKFSSQGDLWALATVGSDFLRLGKIDMETGVFTAVIDEKTYDISAFDISSDNKWLAYTVNFSGRSILRIHSIASGQTRTVTAFNNGSISGLKFAPWGPLGLSFSSNRTGTDSYSLNPATLGITRWTQSEAGGLKISRNAVPELIRIESFDGETISGLLYRPDTARHRGKRPLIINIHGGPESQSKARFLGRHNYLINELGITLFYPNVRGSAGFGNRFLTLDDGPFKREDALRDIGAFIDYFRKDKALNRRRFGVTGASYGGYLTLASMIAYGDKLRAGVESVGISNFVTFLENTEDYRRSLRRREYGDERISEQRIQLQKISPLSQASAIKDPLFIITGNNDPRVPPSEADQMIAAIRGNGGPVWHLRATNEGHGFRKKANIDYRFWSSILFWQRHLLD